jgi:hypothetical protein
MTDTIWSVTIPDSAVNYYSFTATAYKDGQVIWNFCSVDKLSDYPWVRSLDHLKRVNKYRKRVGQHQLTFNEDDMADLALLGDKR